MASRTLSIPQLALLGVILIGAGCARWYRIGEHSFWTDEFLSLEVSSGHGYEHLDEPQGLPIANPAWLTAMPSAGGWGQMILSLRRSTHPPLYFCVLRLWRDLLPGDRDTVVRSLSALMSMLAILLAFDAARWWHGVATALWAAAIMALAAPQVAYAQEARGYAMLVACMMGCCAAIARIETLGFSRRRAAALMVAALAMLLTHYLGAAILAALLLYAMIRFRAPVRARLIGTMLASFLVAMVVWGPILWMQIHGFSKNLAWMVEQPSGQLGRMVERICTLPLRFFVNPGNRPGPEAYGSVILLILPALLLARYPKMLIWCLILWVNVLIIVIGDWTRSSLALEVMRYTLPAAAAANMLAACAAAAAPRRFRHVIPATLLVACMMALPLSYQHDGPDWRQFAGYLDKDCKNDSIIVIYRQPYADGSIGVWDVGLSHYDTLRDRPIVILSKPADTAVLSRLQGRGVVDIIAVSTPASDILPGCKVLQSASFPYVGSCTRVDLKGSMTQKAEHPAVFPTTSYTRTAGL